MSDLESDLERQSAAAGYDEGAQQSRELAIGLKIAAIFIESIDISKINPTTFAIHDALRDNGMLQEGETIESLQGKALEIVRGRAAHEGGIADSMDATRDVLLARSKKTI